MQLSLLPVALPEAGLPRSFRGTRAVMLWDSRGHIAGLVRSHHRTSAVTPWDSDGNAAGLARSRCRTCGVTPQDQRGHSVGLRRSHDGTGMVIPRPSCSSQKHWRGAPADTSDESSAAPSWMRT